MDQTVQSPWGINVFRISGGMTHMISSIEPDDPNQAGFSQIFVVGKGGTEEALQRVQIANERQEEPRQAAKLMPEVVRFWMDFLYAYNPYACIYRLAKTVLDKAGAKTLALVGVEKRGADPKRYNLPTIDEVAVVIEGDGEAIS
jgi:hypothetical protein